MATSSIVEIDSTFGQPQDRQDNTNFQLSSEFFNGLDKTVQRISESLFGQSSPFERFLKKRPSKDHSVISEQQDQQPLSLLENPDPYPQRSIIPPLKGLWYCTNNPKNCQYLQCLAENFQYSDQAEKLKAGSKVIADVDLRRTLIHDPNILKIACDKAKLSKFECTNFKMILGLADAIDPAEFHAEDEPRDKRASSDYYDYLDQQIAAKSSMNQTDGQETMKNPRRKKDCEIILRT